MKKASNGTIILVVSTIAVIGVLGFLLLKKPPMVTPPTGKDTTPPPPSNDVANKIFNAGKSVGDIISGAVTNVLSVGDLKKGANQYELYAINTTGDNLNVRSTPSLKGAIVTQLESFVSIFARPSNVKGWSEVSNDKNSILGYVSTQYLRKL
jgi:hypothetical protein